MEKKTKNVNSFSSQYTWPTARTVDSLFPIPLLFVSYIYRLCQDNVNDKNFLYTVILFMYFVAIQTNLTLERRANSPLILRHISNKKCLFNWTCWQRIMAEKVKALFLKHNTQSSRIDIICYQCFSSGGLNTLGKKTASDKILSNINMLPLASGTAVICFYLLVDLSRANCL